MRAESLRDFPCSVVFENKATLRIARFGFLLSLLARGAVRFVIRHPAFVISAGGGQRPEPHCGQTCVSFEAGRVGPSEDHREGFFRDSGPDLLQVFRACDGFAAGFLDARITGENFQGRAKTGEDGVRAYDAWCGSGSTRAMESEK